MQSDWNGFCGYVFLDNFNKASIKILTLQTVGLKYCFIPACHIKAVQHDISAKTVTYHLIASPCT